MNSRQRAISAAGVQLRAQQARAYLMIADLALDEGTPATRNVAGANAVLAGIAASDAICGHILGARPAGEAHDQAITLLEQATSTRSKASANLKRLLSLKSQTQYSPEPLTAVKTTELVTAARRLVTEMEAVIGL